MKKRLFSLFVFATLSPAAVLAQTPTSSPAVDRNEILDESGARVFKRWQSRFKFCDDESLRSALNDILKELLRPGSRHQYSLSIICSGPFSHTIASLPGGRIIFGSEFLSLTQSWEEVAAAMAHELGHTELGHIEQLYPAAEKLDREGRIQQIIIALTARGRSSEEEKAADAFAAARLTEIGLSPASLLAVLHRLFDQLPQEKRDRELPRISALEALSSTLQTNRGAKIPTLAADQLYRQREQWSELRMRCRLP